MNLSSLVKKKIIDGFVLDRNGKWISIDEAVAQDQEYRNHVESGDVSVNNNWVSIDTQNYTNQVDINKTKSIDISEDLNAETDYNIPEENQETEKIPLVSSSSEDIRVNDTDRSIDMDTVSFTVNDL